MMLLNDLEYSLLRIRMVEEAIAKRYKEQEMRCPVHLSIGQEAIAVGVCSLLTDHDAVFSTHRCHAHYLAKGGCLKAMLAELYGKESGCSKGRGGSMHLIDLSCGFLGSTPIVGGSLPISVGAALGKKMKNEKGVIVAFFGEAVTEEGVFSESLNFAALQALPILFVCENNGFSVNTPLEKRQAKKRDIIQLVEGHGVRAKKGEGNHLSEVVQLTKEALEVARKGEGPFFLELKTHRTKEHCGPFQDPYYTEEEREFWREKDPVKTIDLSMAKEIEKEIEDAFLFAQKSAYPKEVF